MKTEQNLKPSFVKTKIILAVIAVLIGVLLLMFLTISAPVEENSEPAENRQTSASAANTASF